MLDKNANVSRVLAGPLTYTRQEHVLITIQDMIVLLVQNYIEIMNQEKSFEITFIKRNFVMEK